MAEIKSFPNNQDVYVGAEWVMKWLHGRTSGVFGAENNLSTSVVPDSMSVEVSDGVGWLSNANGDGIVFWNDSEQSNGSKLRLTHDVADGTLDRIDRIVVTWETTNYVALPTISILKGIASSNPKPPELTNNNTQRQISLRQQRIPAGAISISSAFGTDERLNSDVCGIVTESVLVDTSVASAQFNELLQLIENNLKQIVANQIADKSVTNEKLADGAVTVQKLSKEVKEFVSADNLLDNSYFRNPVNQRGKTTYPSGSQMYTIDRWKKDIATEVTVSDGYVVITGNDNGFYQILPEELLKSISGKTYTLAAMVKSGSDGSKVSIGVGSGGGYDIFDAPQEWSVIVAHRIYDSGNYPSRNNFVLRAHGDICVAWTVLCEGEYTAETLPEYKPKGYGAELAECQRYYMQFGKIMAPGFLTNSGKCYSMIINTPVAMRVSPSVLEGVKWYARLPSGGYSKYTGSDYTSFTSVSIENYEGNGVVIADNVATAVDTNNIILVYTIQNLCLSADL